MSMAFPDLPPLRVIAGPTASGKSALALAEAEARNGVVINADASQLYADLRILTARPTPEEEARAPHRLYGVRDAAAPCSAAEWATLAAAEIDRAHAAGRLPILVGGTGLYLRTLLDGIAPVPPIDPAVRMAVRAMEPADAHAALVREDPVMGARLAPADRQRTMRALEVVRSTGRSLRDWQAMREGGIGHRVTLEAALLLPDRATLYARCDARLDDMIAAGALDEVACIAARDLPPELPAMKAVGVPPLLAHLSGTLPLEAAVEQAKLDTRRYAKRQMTWFRNQTPSWTRITQS